MRNNGLQTHLRTDYSGCICNSCRKRGCELGLGSLHSDSLVIIDADKYRVFSKVRGKLCDYLLFYLEDSFIVAVVELKGGDIKASKAHKQIQKGAEAAVKIVGSNEVSDFLPLLLHDRRKRIHNQDIKILKSRKVSFKGTNHWIIIEPCGIQLKQILEK